MFRHLVKGAFALLFVVLLAIHGRAATSSVVSTVLPSIPAQARGVVISPQNIVGRVNTAGPEAWPLGESLSTSTQPAPSPPVILPENPPVSSMPPTPVPAPEPQMPPVATSPPVTTSPPQQDTMISKTATDAGNITTMRASTAPLPGGNATRPVIYMDEAGNVVPKPPEPDKLLQEAETSLENGQFAAAWDKFEALKALPISREMREKVLYYISDAVEGLYAGKPLEGFDPIIRATSEAMNANLRSARVPDALFRLGMAHLRVGNVGEAEGYFRALQRRFPYDMNVPVAFANLGTALLDKGLYAHAIEIFQYILQEYPESNVLREAAVGSVKAMVRLRQFKEAAVIADFVDKRWPRYYLTEPAFLELLAQLDLGLDRLEPALQQLWLYYNLEPERKNNDTVLVAMGDIYMRTHRVQPAREMFYEIQRRYPDTPSAEIALQRLAENGIYDSPITIAEMDMVFAHPGNPSPPLAYREMMQRWPGTQRSVLARLKFAMWQLWDKQYTEAMGSAADFIDAHPENANVEQAREIILRGFMAELKNSLAEENYGRILILWNGFPLVRERYGDIDPALRNALARGYIERGEDNKALELLSEFLKTPKHPYYSDPAFALFFNTYLQAGNWNALLDLGDLVKNWEMTPAVRGQLDYALALSAENLGLADKALPLWRTLADNKEIPLYQRAYATYFLAKDAERRKDIKDAYTYNTETLALFTQLAQERSDKADPARIKEAVASLMDITEVANRIPEALDWVERYAEFAPEGSPEYAGWLFRKARLYRKLGDTERAKTYLERIIAKAADSPFAKAAETELRTFAVSRDLREFMPPAQ